MVERIRKCLALAKAAGTQAEANAAAAMAARIAARHQIDLGEVEAAEAQADDYGQRVVLVTARRGRWSNELHVELGVFFGVAALEGRSGPRYVLIFAGQRLAVDQACAVFADFASIIERLAREWTGGFREAYRTGVAEGLVWAMRMARAEEVAAAGPSGSRALARVDANAADAVREVERRLEKPLPRVTPMRAPDEASEPSRRAGVRDGMAYRAHTAEVSRG